MSLFTPEQMQAIGAKDFSEGKPRPEGKETWQLKAKQKGYDEAKAEAEKQNQSLSFLLKQKEEIDAQIKAQHEQTLESVKEAIREHGFTVADLFGVLKAQKAPKTASKVAPKYRDMATGATWTGRGKPPTWIADKDRTQYLIQS
jgi:DNA-binding protein H-NS